MEEQRGILISVKCVISRVDGKILTIRRSGTAPSRPLHWDLPGGNLEYGEDAKDAMRREIMEETGLEVENLKILDFICKSNEKGEYWCALGYTATLAEGEVVLSYEHDDFKWIRPEEFLELESSQRNKDFVMAVVKANTAI